MVSYEIVWQADRTYILARDSSDDIFRGSSQEFGDDGELVNVCAGVEKDRFA